MDLDEFIANLKKWNKISVSLLHVFNQQSQDLYEMLEAELDNIASNTTRIFTINNGPPAVHCIVDNKDGAYYLRYTKDIRALGYGLSSEKCLSVPELAEYFQDEDLKSLPHVAGQPHLMGPFSNEQVLGLLYAVVLRNESVMTADHSRRTLYLFKKSLQP